MHIPPTLMSPNGVALVVNRDYGPALVGVAARMPVGVVSSPRNIPHLALARAQPHSNVTNFKESPSSHPDILAAEYIDSIREHHPAFTDIVIIGCAVTPELQGRLAAAKLSVLPAETGLIVVITTATPRFDWSRGAGSATVEGE